MSRDLLNLLRDALPALSGAPLRVAFSGGLDSTVLLHALHQLRVEGLAAVHVNHGLQADADAWAEHARAFCDALGVRLHVARVTVRESGQGLEAAAREARYAAFKAWLAPGEVLATAHHQQDQAETVLLRALRGTGVTGLAAMHEWSGCGAGRLWRPLLDCAQADLRAYAARHDLRGLDDPHNRDPHFARARLRRLWPQIEQGWPGAAARLADLAGLAREAGEVLDAVAQADLDAALQADASLHIPALTALGAARRHLLLRRWVAHRGLPTPFHDSLRHVDAQLLHAAPDARPLLRWPGAELRRYRDRLYAMPPLAPPPSAFEAAWDGAVALALPGGGALRAMTPLPAGDICRVRLVRAGERFRPVGHAHTRTLKNLFQERGVPPWVRVRTPVLCWDGVPGWIGGLGWAEGQTRAARFAPEWIGRPAGG